MIPTQRIPTQRIAIIGAGLFGCHLGLALRERGHEVVIFEQGQQAFAGASGKNQLRLHLGFHYPRSFDTRREVLETFARFQRQYRPFVRVVQHNLYAVADESHIDFQTYLQIMRSSNVRCNVVDPAEFGLQNVEGCVATDEAVLDCRGLGSYLGEQLKNEICYQSPVCELEESDKGAIVNGEHFDWCLNCTYNALQSFDDRHCIFENCLLLRYRRIPADELALTVMDGPFASFYPLFESGHYSVSDVVNTPLSRHASFAEATQAVKDVTQQELLDRRKMFEASISQFYPAFRSEFAYEGHIVSVKSKLHSATDSRALRVSDRGRIISTYSGKITNVFLFEDLVLQKLSQVLKHRSRLEEVA